jgi:very-short-patch-repair endonuclease
MPTARVFRARVEKQPKRALARGMRHRPVECEKRFWRLVRDRRLGGFKFKRQVLIGSYIVDFVCVERKLVVELDGSQHADQREYDEQRDAFLRAKGFCVVRIWNMELLENPEGVLDMVLAALETAPSP